MDSFTEFTDKLQNVWEGAYRKSKHLFPFYRYNWHDAWRQTVGKDSALVTGNIDECILPFMIDDRTLRFTGEEEVSDYLDVIGPEENKARALGEYLDKIKNRFDKILLRNIPHDSQTVTFFSTNQYWKNRVTITEEDTTPTIALPQSFDEYLAQLDRKSRHELKRKTKRFREEYPLVRFVSDDQVATSPERIFELMSYNPDKQQFLTELMKNFFRSVIKLPYARTDRLVTGNETIAFKIILSENRTMYLYNSGFDPSYQGAGFFLTAESIAHAINQNVKSFNFLQGNERYKYDFGATDFAVVKISSV